MTTDNGHRPALTPDYFKFSPPDYHVEHLFPRDIILFVGNSGSAKSATSLFLSVCTAGERDFLGHCTYYGPVVVVNNEMRDDTHEQWVDKFKRGLGINNGGLPIFCFNYEITDLSSSTQVQKLMARCKSVEAVLLIIDNYGASIGNQDENSTPVAQEVFRNLAKFPAAGITPVVIHHYNADNRIRGSTVIKAQADRIFEFSANTYKMKIVTGVPSKNYLDTFRITNTKSREGAIAPFLIRMEENDELESSRMVFGGTVSDANSLVRCMDRMTQFFRLNPGKGFTYKEISDGMGGADPKTFHRAIEDLESNGTIESRHAGKRLRWYIAGDESEVIEDNFEDKLEEAVLSLCKEWTGTIHLISDMVSVLTPEFPVLTSMGTIWAARTVAQTMRKNGKTVKRKDDGTYVIL